MYVVIETDNFVSFTTCTNNENDDIINALKYLISSITSGVILLFLISLIKYTTLKPSKSNK